MNSIRALTKLQFNRRGALLTTGLLALTACMPLGCSSGPGKARSHSTAELIGLPELVAEVKAPGHAATMVNFWASW